MRSSALQIRRRCRPSIASVAAEDSRVANEQAAIDASFDPPAAGEDGSASRSVLSSRVAEAFGDSRQIL